LRTIIFDIQRGSYVDGPGIRTTVFVKGCHLSCAWCHNPESRAGYIQHMWYQTKCIKCGKCAKKCPAEAIRFDYKTHEPTFLRDKCTLCGKCAVICLNDALSVCGREVSTDEVFAEIKKDISFYKMTGGGMTISGGECLLYPGFTAELLEKCSNAGIHTAADTSGDVPWESFERVLPYTDLFLYDIKCITPSLHREFTGVDNTRILENYKRLLSVGAHVHVRVPMIPECSANDTEFSKIAEFLHENPPKKAELLPYHAMGENKYRALGLGEVRAFSVPDEGSMQRYKDMIKDYL